jgi:hypothetical protein
MVVTRL